MTCLEISLNITGLIIHLILFLWVFQSNIRSLWQDSQKRQSSIDSNYPLSNLPLRGKKIYTRRVVSVATSNCLTLKKSWNFLFLKYMMQWKINTASVYLRIGWTNDILRFIIYLSCQHNAAYLDFVMGLII